MRLLLPTLLLGLLALTGCAEEERLFHEVKHPREILKVAEVNQYLKIVNELPDKQLPPLPPLLSPVPRWDADRELSVQGLVNEERKRNGRQWLSESVVVELQSDRWLQKLLEKNGLSTEQFLGLAETICTAAARTRFPEVDELRRTVHHGQAEISDLQQREEVFSTLPPEEQYEVLRQAAWLTRVDRAQDLLAVPDENVALLERHWEVIAPFLPDEVKQDPLADIVDVLQEFGIPFEELPGTGSDADLVWSPDEGDAIVGHSARSKAIEINEVSY